jgi:hypothetical protein
MRWPLLHIPPCGKCAQPNHGVSSKQNADGTILSALV